MSYGEITILYFDKMEYLSFLSYFLVVFRRIKNLLRKSTNKVFKVLTN